MLERAARSASGAAVRTVRHPLRHLLPVAAADVNRAGDGRAGQKQDEDRGQYLHDEWFHRGSNQHDSKRGVAHRVVRPARPVWRLGKPRVVEGKPEEVGVCHSHVEPVALAKRVAPRIQPCNLPGLQRGSGGHGEIDVANHRRRLFIVGPDVSDAVHPRVDQPADPFRQIGQIRKADLKPLGRHLGAGDRHLEIHGAVVDQPERPRHILVDVRVFVVEDELRAGQPDRLLRRFDVVIQPGRIPAGGRRGLHLYRHRCGVLGRDAAQVGERQPGRVGLLELVPPPVVTGMNLSGAGAVHRSHGLTELTRLGRVKPPRVDQQVVGDRVRQLDEIDLTVEVRILDLLFGAVPDGRQVGVAAGHLRDEVAAGARVPGDLYRRDPVARIRCLAGGENTLTPKVQRRQEVARGAELVVVDESGLPAPEPRQQIAQPRVRVELLPVHDEIRMVGRDPGCLAVVGPQDLEAGAEHLRRDVGVGRHPREIRLAAPFPSRQPLDRGCVFHLHRVESKLRPVVQVVEERFVGCPGLVIEGDGDERDVLRGRRPGACHGDHGPDSERDAETSSAPSRHRYPAPGG